MPRSPGRNPSSRKPPLFVKCAGGPCRAITLHSCIGGYSRARRTSPIDINQTCARAAQPARPPGGTGLAARPQIRLGDSDLRPGRPAAGASLLLAWRHQARRAVRLFARRRSDCPTGRAGCVRGWGLGRVDHRPPLPGGTCPASPGAPFIPPMTSVAVRSQRGVGHASRGSNLCVLLVNPSRAVDLHALAVNPSRAVELDPPEIAGSQQRNRRAQPPFQVVG